MRLRSCGWMGKTLNAKLSLKSESLRLLTDRLDQVAGGQRVDTRNWVCLTDLCTHDLFCPTVSGMCP